MSSVLLCTLCGIRISFDRRLFIIRVVFPCTVRNRDDYDDDDEYSEDEDGSEVEEEDEVCVLPL